MSRPTDSRQRMIRAMSRLMQRQGFHATGLNQVLAESGAPKGSLYFHFPGGKEQLAAEAVQASGDRLR
ncbi:MAG TPA: helix-turn-helix domain-containing protein, partial [Dehalococcoidia bacterium]